ncbi:hypothetical protein O7A70_16675 [Mesorhizobium sp. Cs1299R1N1]|uniref:hypothetical protein n=1 Tax=unclassified Mesorhizobium TaxID=325217 RepID=UPI00301CB0EB
MPVQGVNDGIALYLKGGAGCHLGHGRQRLICGAVTGKIVSQLAAGLPPVIDLATLRADRF